MNGYALLSLEDPGDKAMESARLERSVLVAMTRLKEMMDQAELDAIKSAKRFEEMRMKINPDKYSGRKFTPRISRADAEMIAKEKKKTLARVNNTRDRHGLSSAQMAGYLDAKSGLGMALEYDRLLVEEYGAYDGVYRIEKAPPDDLFANCIHRFPGHAIFGHEILKHSMSQFSFYCDKFADPSRMDPERDDRLALAGIAYEDGIFSEGRATALEHLGKSEEEITDVEVLEVPINLKDLRKATSYRDAFRLCLDEMYAGRKSVHNAPLMYGRLIGMPDVLKKKKGRSAFGNHYYEVCEIKSVHLQQYHVSQAAFYNLLVGLIQRRMPDKFSVLDGYGKTHDFDWESCSESLVHDIQSMLRIMDGLDVPIPTYSGDHHHRWSTYENEMAVKAGGPSILRGIGKVRDEALRNAGFDKAGKIVSSDTEDLAKVPGISSPLGNQIRIHAMSFERNRHIRISEPDIPVHSVEIFLDLEGRIMPEQVFLIGCIVRSAGKSKYMPLLVKKGSAKPIWEKFLKLAGSRKDVMIYHWGSYDRTHAEKACRRKTPVMIDLLKVARKHFAFPIPSNSIGMVARYVGFDPPASGIDGRNVGYMFDEYLDTKNKKILDAILEYNRNDCEAVMRILDWMRSDASR